MADQTKNFPEPMSKDEIVELAKAEEEAGVVDQQTVASAALIQEDRRNEEDS